MLWSEFNPYVLPYVIGAPDPLIAHHVRLAAIDFCRRTACHQATLAPVMTGGSVLLGLIPIPGTQIIKVKAVEVDGRDHALIDPVGGLRLARADSPQEFCFTQDNSTMHIYPAPDAGVSVVVDAILAPSLIADGLDDAIGGAYMQDIALGAIASLQRVPNQSFTEINGSALMQAQYQARVSTTAAKVARGFIGSKMRSRTTYL